MAGRISLVLTALVLVACLGLRPELLSKNEFLNDFIGADYLSLLAVMLTVTLAAVGTVRVSLYKLVSEKFGDDPKKKAAARDAISEAGRNAWWLIGSFFFALVLLLLEGVPCIAQDWREYIFAMALWILILHILVTIDLYRAIYLISEME